MKPWTAPGAVIMPLMSVGWARAKNWHDEFRDRQQD